ncbi:MAG TPA: hypothetical protein VGO17_11230 [Aurantimonas sp.]|nr:hypothetical protein [Aurantimonas sp.]
MLFALVTRLITGEAGIYVARMRRLAALYAIMALFGLMAAAFVFSAFYILLANEVGSLAASLSFAAVFLVLCGVTWILALMARRPPTRRADDRLQRDVASIAGVAALTNAPLLFNSVRRRKSLLLLPVAGAAGFAIWRAISRYRYRIG